MNSENGQKAVKNGQRTGKITYLSYTEKVIFVKPAQLNSKNVTIVHFFHYKALQVCPKDIK